MVGLKYFYGKRLGWTSEYVTDMMRPVLESMKGKKSGQTTLVTGLKVGQGCTEVHACDVLPRLS